jgi:O-antigen/teichoic acid export membrane protein
MDDKKIMKKNGFVGGAIVSTVGIVISKILGIIYVIPFHALVGSLGGALYGYAYTLYSFFLSISTAGIPLSVSKVVSHYNAKGYYGAKKRAFSIARKMALLMGFICFLFLFLFAPLIANLIMGNLSGGNSIEDITLVIRVISLAMLVIPTLSIYRGYIQGHKIMTPPAISQVIEQIVRVTIIILGSYLVIKVFKKSVSLSVMVALLGALVGAVFALLYLSRIYRKHKKDFNEKESKDEPLITNSEIVKLILIYAVPFIMIDVVKTLYDLVDTTTVVRGLVGYANYSTEQAETVMGMISTWGKKINMIIISINSGIVLSLIPALSESITKKDQKNINKHVNDSFSLLSILAIPMAIGISMLSYPIWIVFYGSGDGAMFLSYFIFVALFTCLFTLSVTIIQLFRDYKLLLISMTCGLLFKIGTNIVLINSFYKMGLPAYYGAITASIIGYLITFVICVIALKKKYKIRFKEFRNNLLEIVLGAFIMFIVLYFLSLIIPIEVNGRIHSLLVILLYALVGIIVYFIYTYKTGLIKKVLGNKIDKYIHKKIEDKI